LEVSWDISDVKSDVQKAEIDGFSAEIVISKATV
jgi:hypothetical protein